MPTTSGRTRSPRTAGAAHVNQAQTLAFVFSCLGIKSVLGFVGQQLGNRNSP